jgi:hypothetical protein
MHTHPSVPLQRSLNALDSLKRDLAHAARSLARDRAFSLVCVISLGIGIGALVALATFGRAITAPARGITTAGLTELLVLPQGPLRARAGVWALEQWSYPDFRPARQRHRHVPHRMGPGVCDIGVRVPDEAELRRVATLYVSANYFSTFGVSLARGPGFDPALDDAPSAEPRVVLSHDFWRIQTSSDPDIVGKSVVLDGVAAYGRGDRARRLSWPLSLLPGARFPGVPSPGATPASAGESEPSRRQDRGLGADTRPAEPRRRHQARQCAGLDDRVGSGTALSRHQRIQGRHRRALRLDGCGRSPRVAPRPQHHARPGGSGPPGRVPQHLGHDAGPRHQARARAEHPRGTRRRAAASHPASVLRSGAAGGRGRRDQRVRPVRHSGHRRMVSRRAGSRRDRSRCGQSRDRRGPLPARERALRIAAGRALQPSQSDRSR